MNSTAHRPNILFSDFFHVEKRILDQYGAFDISLLADLPLFVDPFLLFNSEKQEYLELHQEIIDYLRFLRAKSVTRHIDVGLLSAWYKFKEIKQNWFGFSARGNKGSGLGDNFASALNENFNKIFNNYGAEQVTRGTHLEKLCLIKDRVGRDNISDFTTNLIKHFPLEYTERFAKTYLDPKYCQDFRVTRAIFNYDTENWQERNYYLPKFKGDFVILTPKDLLTKDETWINRADMIDDFESIPPSINDHELRSNVDNYFRSMLSRKKSKRDDRAAASSPSSVILTVGVSTGHPHSGRGKDTGRRMACE